MNRYWKRWGAADCLRAPICAGLALWLSGFAASATAADADTLFADEFREGELAAGWTLLDNAAVREDRFHSGVFVLGIERPGDMVRQGDVVRAGVDFADATAVPDLTVLLRVRFGTQNRAWNNVLQLKLMADQGPPLEVQLTNGKVVVRRGNHEAERELETFWEPWQFVPVVVRWQTGPANDRGPYQVWVDGELWLKGEAATAEHAPPGLMTGLELSHRGHHDIVLDRIAAGPGPWIGPQSSIEIINKP